MRHMQRMGVDYEWMLIHCMLTYSVSCSSRRNHSDTYNHSDDNHSDDNYSDIHSLR